MKLDLQFFASGVITPDEPSKSSSGTKLIMKVEWSSVANELENTSTVTTKLFGKRADSLSGATTHSKWSGSVKVGSNAAHTFSSVSNTSVSTTWVLFKTYTDVIEHDADGTKSVTISGSLTGPTGTTLAGVTSSESKTVDLDKIPRQSNLEEIPRFDIDMGFVLNAEKPVDTFYRKLNIKNGDVILRTIFEEDLVNGYEYLLSDDINTIYGIMSNEIEHTFTFDLYTYEDSTMATQIGSVSTQTAVGYITDCSPTFSGFDCIDNNAVTVALTGDNTIFIPNESNAQITIGTPATSYKGATIVGYNIIGNQIEYVPASDYPMVHTIYEVNSSFGVQAVDSRGLVSNTIYKNLTWVSGYVAPKIQNLRLIREGGVSENVAIAFSGTIWEGNFGQGENKVTHVVYRVKQNDGTFSEWFDITDRVNIVTPTFIIDESDSIYIHENGNSGGFSTGASYTVELMLYDGIEATTFNSSYATTFLDDGKVLDSYYKAGSGYRYAINGIVDPDGDVLQVYDDDGNLIDLGSGGGGGSEKATTNEMLKVKTTKLTTIEISSAWTRIEVPFAAESEKIGKNLTLTSNGRIKIGSGIDKISIHSHLLATPSTIGTIETRLCVFRNGTQNNVTGFYVHLDKINDYRSVVMNNPIVEVQENDEICVMVTSDVANTLKFATDGYLCVEKIYETNVISGGVVTGSTTVFEGTLLGGESMEISNHKRFLDIYYEISLTNHKMCSKYIIDTALNEPTFGSTVISAADSSTSFDYYISECKFEKSTKTLTHTKAGYFNISKNTYTSRTNDLKYHIYRIDTYD